jgi:hypothetical protein
MGLPLSWIQEDYRMEWAGRWKHGKETPPNLSAMRWDGMGWDGMGKHAYYGRHTVFILLWPVSLFTLCQVVLPPASPCARRPPRLPRSPRRPPAATVAVSRASWHAREEAAGSESRSPGAARVLASGLRRESRRARWWPGGGFGRGNVGTGGASRLVGRSMSMSSHTRPGGSSLFVASRSRRAADSRARASSEAAAQHEQLAAVPYGGTGDGAQVLSC